MQIGNKKISVAQIGGKLKSIKWGKHAKKNLIILASVVLIGGAVYLNWSFFSSPSTGEAGTGETETTENDKTNDSSAAGSASVSADDYFTQTIISRQRACDESMEVLSLIVDNEEALEDAKTQAWSELNEIASNIEAEANIETLVVSKGFDDCVAVISSGMASVIVKSDGLLDNEITQIQEIVFEQSGIEPANLKIIQK